MGLETDLYSPQFGDVLIDTPAFFNIAYFTCFTSAVLSRAGNK